MWLEMYFKMLFYMRYVFNVSNKMIPKTTDAYFSISELYLITGDTGYERNKDQPKLSCLKDKS